MRGLSLACALGGAALLLCACDGFAGDQGELSVLLEPEDTILLGLDPGEGVEDIRDGWEARFDSYLVSLGAIDLHLATDPELRAEDPELFVVDLARIPASGLPLWSLGGLRAGRWEFHYAIRGAADGASRHEAVSEADYNQMASGDRSHLIAGRIARAGGRSCPPASLALPGEALPSGEPNARGEGCYPNPEIRFRFGVSVGLTYGPCEVDGVPGFSVPAGGSQTVAITLHGDHLFFNGFPEGAEGGIMRLAQWLADCDLDLDGEVTREELEQIAPSDLAELDARFQLGGSPIAPLWSMWDYLRAQLHTQGHFQGEGECALVGATSAP